MCVLLKKKKKSAFIAALYKLWGATDNIYSILFIMFCPLDFVFTKNAKETTKCKTEHSISAGNSLNKF